MVPCEDKMFIFLLFRHEHESCFNICKTLIFLIMHASLKVPRRLFVF